MRLNHFSTACHPHWNRVDGVRQSRRSPRELAQLPIQGINRYSDWLTLLEALHQTEVTAPSDEAHGSRATHAATRYVRA